jgi:hypothetical protein
MKRLNDLTRVIVAATLLVGVIVVVVFVAPRLLYPPLPASRFAGVTPDKRIELETNRLKLQNDARTTLLQGLAGGVLLLGAYFTWRQLSVTREGQITERYTRAIDQLGHAQLDVRLGGIFGWAGAEQPATGLPAATRTGLAPAGEHGLTRGSFLPHLLSLPSAPRCWAHERSTRYRVVGRLPAAAPAAALELAEPLQQPVGELLALAGVQSLPQFGQQQRLAVPRVVAEDLHQHPDLGVEVLVGGGHAAQLDHDLVQ